MKELVTQSCPTLCNLMDCSPPGFSIHGILRARILEWIAISFSRASSRPRNQTQVSRIAGRFFTVWATRESYYTYKVKESEVAQSCPTLCGACTRRLHPWDFLDKSTGMGCHFLLQGIFPTRRLNPGLLHCRQTLYCLTQQGSRYYTYNVAQKGSYSRPNTGKYLVSMAL